MIKLIQILWSLLVHLRMPHVKDMSNAKFIAADREHHGPGNTDIRVTYTTRCVCSRCVSASRPYLETSVLKVNCAYSIEDSKEAFIKVVRRTLDAHSISFTPGDMEIDVPSRNSQATRF